jgi:PAS domain S-box-containing protein
MTITLPSELQARSTRRLMIERVRLIMLICILGGVIFGGKELLRVHHATPQFWTQMLGITLATSTFFLLRWRRLVPWAWPLSIFIISFTYSITAFAGTLSPTREYWTTVVLFVGAALMTATIVPWGLYGQAVTVGVGLLALSAGVLHADGNLWVVITDPGVAVLVAFGLSIVTAGEVDRYRIGHRRELVMRRRSELANRRLNAVLEQRVVERTAELQRANTALEREVVERMESQRRLADVVDHSNALVTLKDPRGRYMLVNREFERLFMISRQEVLGYSDRDVFPPQIAAVLRERDEDVLRGGLSVSFEQELAVQGGGRAFVAVKFPLRDSLGTCYGIGTVATDITGVKQLQDELRRHQDELAHVLRLHTVSEMTAGLAHEINQPLCAISNYAQGAAQRLRNDNADKQHLLTIFDRIAEEGLRAGQIIRGMRHLVQRTSPVGESIDVNELAVEALHLLESRARRDDVEVRLEAAADLPRICADAAQIEQVIVNLVLNGVEAIHADVGDRRWVTVTTALRQEGVEVAVSDTGEGVESNAQEKLFTPFFTTKIGGLGLGLVISRSIVELHGGRLWATGNPDGGMTFHFWLPAALEQPGKSTVTRKSAA